MSLGITHSILSLVGAWLLYQLIKALYNLSPLHPLSHIPGPKLAASTYLYEFYYDVIKFGCYTKEIRAMHSKYGEWTSAGSPLSVENRSKCELTFRQVHLFD